MQFSRVLQKAPFDRVEVSLVPTKNESISGKKRGSCQLQTHEVYEDACIFYVRGIGRTKGEIGLLRLVYDTFNFFEQQQVLRPEDKSMAHQASSTSQSQNSSTVNHSTCSQSIQELQIVGYSSPAMLVPQLMFGRSHPGLKIGARCALRDPVLGEPMLVSREQYTTSQASAPYDYSKATSQFTRELLQVPEGRAAFHGLMSSYLEAKRTLHISACKTQGQVPSVPPASFFLSREKGLQVFKTLEWTEDEALNVYYQFTQVGDGSAHEGTNLIQSICPLYMKPSHLRSPHGDLVHLTKTSLGSDVGLSKADLSSIRSNSLNTSSDDAYYGSKLKRSHLIS